MQAWTGWATTFSVLGNPDPTIRLKPSSASKIMSINVFSTPGGMVMPPVAAIT
jgi:hypothetical protein